MVAIRTGALVAVFMCLASCEAGGKGQASMTNTRLTDATTATTTTTTFMTIVDPERGLGTERVDISAAGPSDSRPALFSDRSASPLVRASTERGSSSRTPCPTAGSTSSTRPVQMHSSMPGAWLQNDARR